VDLQSTCNGTWYRSSCRSPVGEAIAALVTVRERGDLARGDHVGDDGERIGRGEVGPDEHADIDVTPAHQPGHVASCRK
jgi:hypothetical protein